MDIKPDVVVNIGDAADMASLCSYDRGTRSFQGRSYRADIEAHLEFQDKIWGPVYRRKKRLPETIFCIGNHEQRIERALDLSPELSGTIGMDNLELTEWYDHVVPYEGGTPGVINVDGINYAHYFISGVMGRPIGGEHPAYTYLSKHHVSGTCGHSHIADFCVRTNGHGRKIFGAHCGVFIDEDMGWAGNSNRLYWRGVLVKREVKDGVYDAQWISMEALKNEYK